MLGMHPPRYVKQQDGLTWKNSFSSAVNLAEAVTRLFVVFFRARKKPPIKKYDAIDPAGNGDLPPIGKSRLGAFGDG
jgi:hypothetical protein